MITKHSHSKQEGAALVVGLIILALMTIIGMTAVQSSIVENRIATNMLDKQLSFEAAEAALRDAEAWINDQADHPMPKLDGSSNVWPKDTLTTVVEGGVTTYISPKDIAWDVDGRCLAANRTSGQCVALEYGEFTGAETISGVSLPAKFVIEEFTFVPDDWSTATIAAGKGLFFYRVTAKGYGASVDESGKPVATTVIQTMYRKRFN